MGGWQGGGAQGENGPDWSRGRVWWALPPDAAQKPAARRTGAGGGGADSALAQGQLPRGGLCLEWQASRPLAGAHLSSGAREGISAPLLHICALWGPWELRNPSPVTFQAAEHQSQKGS